MKKKIDCSFLESSEDLLDLIMDELKKDPELVIELYDGDVHKGNMISIEKHNEMKEAQRLLQQIPDC